MAKNEEKITSPEVLEQGESEAPGHCVGCHEEQAAF
jgi:hypothetical protein